ncbi:MAG: MFS transporter [Alphaproteobacteria bacterium]|nr:MFS transporter [Alphaproteobacteria bacterium]
MAPDRQTADDGAPPRKSAIAAWCLYDWANSSIVTVVLTFVFAVYFAKGVSADEIAATHDWGMMLAASGVAVALLSVVLGPIADKTGRRKPWLLAATVVAVACGMALWWIEKDPAYVPAALLLVAALNVAFEIGTLFYNAMLPDVAPARMLGRISGWGWGLGYVGGIACLLLALPFVLGETAPFGLDKATGEHVRATCVLAAAWYLVFAIPLFLFVPDRPGTGMGMGAAALEGLREVAGTVRLLRAHPNLLRFLVARTLYQDGLNTLFAFGGIYAAGTVGMNETQIIAFGILMNVMAGAGAFAFAWLDDRMGSRRTVLAALAGLLGFGLPVLLTDGVTAFYVFGLGLAIFIGPAQAASRTFMARLTPPGHEAQMFGLFNLTGKAISPLGPLVFGTATALFASQRAGMATILLFFAAGFAVLWFVREPGLERGGR